MRNPKSIIMKKLLLLSILSILPTYFINAQEGCGTITPEGYTPKRITDPNYKEFKTSFLKQLKSEKNKGAASKTTSSKTVNYSPSCLTSVPVMAHIVNQNNGTGGMTAAEYYAALDKLNAEFALSCLEFYQCGPIDFINNTTYFDLEPSESSYLFENHRDLGVINLYIVNSLPTSNGGICGQAGLGGTAGGTIYLAKSCVTNGNTLEHEIGHHFSLMHTHGASNDELTDELVNGTNCDTTGDGICDTPADPNLYGKVSNCNYIGNEVDANGDLFNPDEDLVMSYAPQSCRGRFSDEQYAAMYYHYMATAEGYNCSTINADFVADQTSSCSTPFTVNFTSQSIGATSYEWDFNNDGIADATGASASYTYTSSGAFDVRLTISDGTTTIHKVKDDYISIVSKTAPLKENFESFPVSSSLTSGLDGWTSYPTEASEYRWVANKGATQWDGTGPDMDHTTGNTTGTYLYTDCPLNGATQYYANLTSPCITIPEDTGNNNHTVKFWYHMYGAAMGRLHMDIFDGNTWIENFSPAIEGQQQISSTDAYLSRSFSIEQFAGQTIKIRFRAYGYWWSGQIAIDDFEIYNDNCSPTDPDSDGDGICDSNDICPNLDDSLVGMPCDDGDPCTVNDVYGTDCGCAGTYADSDADGVCDAYDACENGDDSIDTDGDGIPDACDAVCIGQTLNFNSNPLTHSGSGVSTTTMSFPENTQEVAFTVSDLNSKGGGSPKTRYNEKVKVTYENEFGQIIVHDIFYGTAGSTFDVFIAEIVKSVTVELSDSFGVNNSSLSVTLSAVSFCAPPCADDDNDGVCNIVDVCPNGDDTLDGDGDGIPDACDNCFNINKQFSTSNLTLNSSSGSVQSTAILNGMINPSFTINGLGAKINGKTSGRYIDLVQVNYTDMNGTNFSHQSYSGENQSSAVVSLPGVVQSVTVILTNSYNGSTLSVNVILSQVSSCGSSSSVQADRMDRNINDLPLFDINSFKIFPNPAKNRFSINFTANKGDNYKLMVRDVLGRSYFEHTFKDVENNVQTELSSQHWETGLYFIILENESDTYTKKLIINR